MCNAFVFFVYLGPPKALDEDETEFLDNLATVSITKMFPSMYDGVFLFYRMELLVTIFYYEILSPFTLSLYDSFVASWIITCPLFQVLYSNI